MNALDGEVVLGRIRALATSANAYRDAALFVRNTGASFSAAAIRFDVSRAGVIAAAGKLGIAARRSSKRGRPQVHVYEVGQRVRAFLVEEVDGAQLMARCDCGSRRWVYASWLANPSNKRCGRACPLPRATYVQIHANGRKQVRTNRARQHFGPRYRTVAQRVASILKAVHKSARGRIAGVAGSGRTRRQLAVDLTVQDVVELRLNQRCTYCEAMLGDDHCGLDRIDNAIGYTRSNVLPCCKDCNLARGSRLSVEEFRAAISARKSCSPSVMAPAPSVTLPSARNGLDAKQGRA